jgi:hypothetical protein
MSPASIAESVLEKFLNSDQSDQIYQTLKKTDWLIGEIDFTIRVGLDNNLGGCVIYLSIFFPVVPDFHDKLAVITSTSALFVAERTIKISQTTFGFGK